MLRRLQYVESQIISTEVLRQIYILGIYEIVNISNSSDLDY